MQGPITASHWEVFGKDIWLFGDMHDIKRGCKGRKYKEITKFIDEEANISSSEPEKHPKIEIFVENPFNFSKNFNDNYLARVDKIFRKCMEESCRVKYHAADRRDSDVNLRSLVEISATYFNGSTYRVRFYEPDEDDENQSIKFDLMEPGDFTLPYVTYTIWDDLYPDKKEGEVGEMVWDQDTAYFDNAIRECQKLDKLTVGEWLDGLFLSLKVQKQIDKIVDDSIRKRIDRYFTSSKKIYNPWRSKTKKIRKMSMHDIGEAVKKIKNRGKLTSDEVLFMEGILGIGSLIMDKYLIARVFGPSVGKRVIIYVGDWHRESYAKFFKSVGGKRIMKTRRSKYQCIKLPERLFP